MNRISSINNSKVITIFGTDLISHIDPTSLNFISKYSIRSRSMIRTLVFLSIVLSSVSWAENAPIPDGEHNFTHRFAEHPTIKSIQLHANIEWPKVKITNSDNNSVFPFGIIAQGEIAWHKPTKQWIIITSPEDRKAQEVGGCSDGPEVVDLENKIYWTC